MSLESVREECERLGLGLTIVETVEETSTVERAARVLGVEEARIAKTLAFRLADKAVMLLVTRGDARIDNAKFKQRFGRGKMLVPEEVEALTGHPVGGVCPFGLPSRLPIFADLSLQAFDRVYPAAGNRNSALCIAPDLLAQATQATWVDVCKLAD